MSDETIDEQVGTLIVKCYKTGEKLPSEKEMIDMFDISRSRLRNVLNVYQGNGVISSQRGSGRHVCVPDIGKQIVKSWEPFVQAEESLLMDLLDIRRMLDIAAIPMEINKINYEQIRDIGQQVSEMKRKAALNQTFASNDREFHRILSSSTGNVLLVQLMNAFWDLYEKTKLEEYHSDLTALAKQHEEMLQAVVQKDEDKLQKLFTEQYADAKYQIVRSITSGTVKDA